VKTAQIPRRITHARTRLSRSARKFDYLLDYRTVNFRQRPQLYRVGVGEQGVLLVEPYKSEILPHWRFRTPADASVSSRRILKLFRHYLRLGDFVGADMARKFLQMGYTRSRRYANHATGRKYSISGAIEPLDEDPIKAESARIFHKAWKKAEEVAKYSAMKAVWKKRLG
jgi:hypothetical protein